MKKPRIYNPVLVSLILAINIVVYYIGAKYGESKASADRELIRAYKNQFLQAVSELGIIDDLITDDNLSVVKSEEVRIIINRLYGDSSDLRYLHEDDFNILIKMLGGDNLDDVIELVVIKMHNELVENILNILNVPFTTTEGGSTLFVRIAPRHGVNPGRTINSGPP